MAEIASALFNKVLVKVLGKFLSYYMNNFSRDSFKLEMLRGTFTLADIGAICARIPTTPLEYEYNMSGRVVVVKRRHQGRFVRRQIKNPSTCFLFLLLLELFYAYWTNIIRASIPC